MKTRIPIYAKIFGWFFANVLVLGIVIYVLMGKHFGWGSEWLLTPDSKMRIRSMLLLLRADLDAQPPTLWNDVFARYQMAYHMRFGLYRNQGAAYLAGEEMKLPDEVKAAITARPSNPNIHPPPRREDPPPFDPLDFNPPLPPPNDGPPDGRMPLRDGDGLAQEPTSDIISTGSPKQYWLLMRGVRFEQNLGRGPQPTTVVAMTGSLIQSSLLFDFKPWLLAAGGMFVFSVLFWIPLVRSLTHATTQMTEAAEKIASGDFNVQVNGRRRDELGRLGAAINQMTARLSGFVSGQKRFLGDIAHELCSPLVRMEMALGVLEQRAPAELNKRVSDVQDEVREMRELVNELLNFSKAGLQGTEAPLEPLALAPIVQSIVERDGEDVQMRTVVPPNLRVLGSRTLLTRAISNVVRNAIRYAGDDGPVTITARPLNGQIVITITDEGPGVPSEALPQLFDAFYRPDIARDRESGGVGLGLAIVKTCIDACKGTVSARNRDSKGLEVSINLERAG